MADTKPRIKIVIPDNIASMTPEERDLSFFRTMIGVRLGYYPGSPREMPEILKNDDFLRAFIKAIKYGKGDFRYERRWYAPLLPRYGMQWKKRSKV